MIAFVRPFSRLEVNHRVGDRRVALNAVGPRPEKKIAWHEFIEFESILVAAVNRSEISRFAQPDILLARIARHVFNSVLRQHVIDEAGAIHSAIRRIGRAVFVIEISRCELERTRTICTGSAFFSKPLISSCASVATLSAGEESATGDPGESSGLGEGLSFGFGEAVSVGLGRRSGRGISFLFSGVGSSSGGSSSLYWLFGGRRSWRRRGAGFFLLVFLGWYAPFLGVGVAKNS